MSFIDRLQHGWNAFMNKDPTPRLYSPGQYGTTYRPDRVRYSRGNERSIITSVYNKIALDAAAIKIKHVKLDSNDRYMETVKSGLNECLTISANKDQTPRAFLQDVYASMFDEGCVAVVPIDTDIDPNDTNTFFIESIRVGKITEWKPDEIKVEVYNDNVGAKQELWFPKNKSLILENPFYAIMNEPNSTLQRLIRKLNLLDQIDEQTGANKLDLIIQLPYVIKSEARRKQAEDRRKDIEEQLSGSKYGIAYTDGTEHITQLNRSVDNQLMNQIEYLHNTLYSQLGLTTSILDGTADEKAMLNYNNRLIEPIVSTFVDEAKRKWLTKTARTQGQSIMFFTEPFKLVPVNNLADIADKFTRNEILSSNEVRQIIGMKPVNDPKADELRNKNLNAADGQRFATSNDSTTSIDDLQSILNNSDT